MPPTIALKIDIPPDIADEIDGLVESGDYASATDVVHAAMQEWLENRQYADDLIDAIGIEEIRRLVQEGIDSGPGELLDIEAIIAEARRRFGAGRK